MAYHPKRIAEKLQRVTTAWETLAAGSSFAGMTLVQFKNRVKGSLDHREDLATLEAQRVAKLDDRDDSDKDSGSAMELVVSAVRGDPAFGPDSALLEAMGYVRKSERKSGLTKKKNGNGSGNGQP